MNTYIHESLIDIERRINEILDDIHSLHEQVFYTYDPDFTGSEEIPEALDSDRREAFEYMVNNGK
jgi:hypothetical protein